MTRKSRYSFFLFPSVAVIFPKKGKRRKNHGRPLVGPIGEDQSWKRCRLCADKAFSRLIELLVLSITRQTQAVPRPTVEKRKRGEKGWKNEMNGEGKGRGGGGRKKKKGKDEARTMREESSFGDDKKIDP